MFTRGHKFSEETKKKISTTLKNYYKNGGIHPNLGKKFSEKTKKKLSQAKIGKKRAPFSQQHLINLRNAVKKGKEHYLWRGNKVKYVALHDWVRYYLGKPRRCEHCGKTNLKGHKIHWANRSHKYKRDLNDWIRLCVKCHKIYDKTNPKNKVRRRISNG